MIPSYCLEAPVRFPKAAVKFVFGLILNSGGVRHIFGGVRHIFGGDRHIMFLGSVICLRRPTELCRAPVRNIFGVLWLILFILDAEFVDERCTLHLWVW
jgi:hypothetical protein